MFNMGGGEIILVAFVALIVIPPDKLPGVATNLGRFFVQLQRGFNELKNGFEKNIKDINLEIQTPRPKAPPRLNPPEAIPQKTSSEEKPKGTSEPDQV